MLGCLEGKTRLRAESRYRFLLVLFETLLGERNAVIGSRYISSICFGEMSAESYETDS